MTMGHSQMLALLKRRAGEVQLRGCVLQVEEVPKEPLGLFIPPRTIKLFAERSPHDKLLTLLHEIGHFWSFTVGRRKDGYQTDHDAWEPWFRKVRFDVMSTPEALAYRRNKDVPRQLRHQKFRELSQKKPMPIPAQRALLLFEEEELAWTFAYAAAELLACDLLGELVVEATAALEADRVYFCVPAVESWNPTVSNLLLSQMDWAYIADLTTPSAPLAL